MIISTTETLPNYKVVKFCGLAKGCSVRALHVGDDVMARLKNAVGGEVHEYTQVFAQVREQALDRLYSDAHKMGANAIIGVRFQTAEIGSAMAELMVYGTAVVVEEV